MDSLQLLTHYLTLTPIFSGRKAKINLHMTPKLTVVIPISCLLPCADPGIFVRGGGGGRGPRQSDKKKALTALFVFVFCFFLVLGLFYRSHVWLISKKNIIFQGSGGGPNFSRGGGSNCLFPIETQITCDFPGGSGLPAPPPPPLDPQLAAIFLVSQSAK